MIDRRIARLTVLVTALVVGSRASAQRPSFTYLAIDLKTNGPIVSIRPDRLDVPVFPGSVIKIATLAAALEAGVIDPRAGILCTRETVVAGHRLICTHPEHYRPLRAAEALAHSCNVFFASVSTRLSRAELDRAFGRLGLAPSDRSRPLDGAALGVDGIRVAPRRLVEMLARVGAEPNALGWRPATLATIREGLRGAVQFGTASAIGERGIDAMAKTGTTLMGRAAQGLVVGVTPSANPTVGFVLLAPGAAGADAAALAADQLAQQSAVVPKIGLTVETGPGAASTVRVGVAGGSGGYTVRSIPIEEYVAGVLTGEAASQSAPAALEALAITIRTFAIANRGRHAADGFDLCDLTHCQVLRQQTRATERAASATAGRVLLYRNRPASVFYTASCGGYTERASTVWPGAAEAEFLPSRPDQACGGQPTWSADLSAADLVRALRAGGFTGESLLDLRVIRRHASGRVAWMQVEGFTPREISGENLRTLVGRTLGWQHVKSTAFDLTRTGTGYQVVGRGSGHGVGLCVIGAARLATQGQSAEAILSRYFPGLRIAVFASGTARTTKPEVRIALPSDDQGERDVLHDLAVRARDALVSKLGVTAPPRITLRFHPTVESYQRATGQPWFTAGATLNNDAHFIPIAVLRERGLLERTIRHELAHILTEPSLAGRSLWVREGAAAYFAGERGSSDTAESEGFDVSRLAPCPDDREWQQPVSADALRGAYARATACFARQVKSGKSWREVR